MIYMRKILAIMLCSCNPCWFFTNWIASCNRVQRLLRNAMFFHFFHFRIFGHSLLILDPSYWNTSSKHSKLLETFDFVNGMGKYLYVSNIWIYTLNFIKFWKTGFLEFAKCLNSCMAPFLHWLFWFNILEAFVGGWGP